MTGVNGRRRIAAEETTHAYAAPSVCTDSLHLPVAGVALRRALRLPGRTSAAAASCHCGAGARACRGIPRALPQHTDVQLVGIADGDPALVCQVPEEVFIAGHAVLSSSEANMIETDASPGGAGVYVDCRASSRHRDRGEIWRVGDGGEAADDFPGGCPGDPARRRGNTRFRCW